MGRKVYNTFMLKGFVDENFECKYIHLIINT
jgi:hypothetical protein